MANNPSNDDKYIIIGVEEKNGIASKFYDVLEFTDQAHYQQYLDSNVEPPIRFEYKQFNYKEFTLSYYRIYDNVDRPYLFKKDIDVPAQSQQLKYNRGDGFIRVGTSTRRLARPDFESIYAVKLGKTDRRSDLEVSFNIGKAEDDFNIVDEKYFDLSVENTSFKSIGFDIEMRVYFDEVVSVRSRDSLKRTMILPRSGNRFEFETIFNPILPNLDVNVEETEYGLIIERNKGKFEKYAVKLPQKSNIIDVFDQELILDSRSNYTLNAEVIIRSDEFINGPLIFKIEKVIANT